MKIIVDNCIKVEKPTSAVLNFCKKALVFDNPDYCKKERLGKWVGNTPKQLYLYEKKGDTLVIPFGCLRDVWCLCPNADWDIKILPIKGVEYGQGINMYSYQENAVESVLRVKNGVLVMPCGSGKTNCGLEVVRRVGGKALWLTHTQDLLAQSMLRAKNIFDLPDECYGTITSGRVNIGTHITFATVQTMCKIDLEAHKNDFDIIVVDECFPANTKITTKNGIKDLQNLRIDDIILSYNRYAEKFEYKKVKHLFKLKAHNIVKVKLSNGKEIITTSNHPFFTQKGEWVDAENLGGNDYVMRLVRQGVRRNKKTINNKKQNKKAWLWILFKRVCSQGRSQERCLDGRTQKKSCGNNEKNKREISRLYFRKNENEQSYEQIRGASQNFKKIERNRALPQNQMWKWSRAYSSSTKFVNRIIKAFRSLCRISDTHKNENGKRLSYLLQGGYRDTRKYVCNRSGRQFTLCNRTTTTRQKERQLFEWVRVDSVEVQKQTSDGTFGGLCPDGFVYNIEVEDNNNYFANGVLVHNCQHLVGSPTKVTQFYKVVSSLSARYKIGLTATPKRADGLESAMFAILGDVICEVDKNAIADYVCPVKVKKVHTGYTPDFEAIVGGDGTLDYAKLVDDLIHNKNRFKFVLTTIEKIKPNQPILVLGNRVEYLKALQKEYFGSSLCLSAVTKKEERKEALKALNNGDIDCIFASYKLAAEGLDCPNLRYVVFATPEKNEVTVVQSVGRVGRKAEGKDFGTVIDFVDDFTMYENWSKQRDRFYKKIDAEII